MESPLCSSTSSRTSTTKSMDIALFLIIVGIILAVLVHFTLGILLVIFGFVLLVLPSLRR